MNPEIDDYYKNGILLATIEAERNICIWKKIADEYDFLINQDPEINKLYGYLQASAASSFTLHTSKLYDPASKKYSTRSIQSFLELIKKEAGDFPEIIEKPGVEKLLKEYNVSDKLKKALYSKNPSEFPIAFHEYYSEKYKTLSSKINVLKDFRDKVIAHNEQLEEELNELSLEIIEELLAFAIEIILIFGMTYYGYYYGDKENNSIKRDADRNTFFIESAISSLKK